LAERAQQDSFASCAASACESSGASIQSASEHVFRPAKKKLKKVLHTSVLVRIYTMTNTEKSSNKATHRGTCQACGRVQAVWQGSIAKHGYTVDWGHFNGVCQGAHALPMEQQTTLTVSIIAIATKSAERSEQLAVDLESGAIAPMYFKSVYNRAKCKSEKVEVAKETLMPYEVDQCLSLAVHQAKSRARDARYHAKLLTELMAARFGQALIPVKLDKKELAAGAIVRVGGKNGIDCEVLEIKHMIASGCGPYMNGQRLPHAIMKREDGRTFAMPTKTIRQSAIVKGGAL
jgi:hypothetical protein